MGAFAAPALAEIMEEIRRRPSDETESKLLSYVNKGMDQLQKDAKKLGYIRCNGIRPNIGLKGIKQCKETLTYQIKGHIGHTLNERLVRTDPELWSILEEENDTLRREHISEFVTRIQKESLKNLRSKIEKTIATQVEQIRADIRCYQLDIFLSQNEPEARNLYELQLYELLLQQIED